MPEKIVGNITEITHPKGERATITIQFDDGRSASLDQDTPEGVVYAETLEGLREMRSPVYVEVDSEKQITHLLIPLVAKITAFAQLESGDIQVELEPSQAKHFLRKGIDDYERFMNVLSSAKESGRTLFVTETQETHEIIDVRLAPNPNTPATDLLPALGRGADVATSLVTPEKAEELFGLVNSQSCKPTTAAAPCIPFLYPDDGCWARAHEMCRLIINEGVSPNKSWIYGDLEVDTVNHPHCRVLWSWHVAPTLRVKVGSSTHTLVLDPSIFSEPVSKSKWKAAQKDANAVLASTDSSIFLRSRTGSTKTDMDYAKNLKELKTYRLRLKLRAVSVAGPPPYAKCK